jgi:hypothetical protein
MSIREDSPEDQGRRRTQKRHDEQEERRPTPPTSPERAHGPANPVSTHLVNAIEAARTDLFATMRRVHDNDKPKTVAVNIATAQRLVLADMQHDIAAQTALVLGDAVRSVDIKRLGILVKEYCMFILIIVIMSDHD